MEKLAFFGGNKIKTKPFPIWPVFDEKEESQLIEVLHSGHWWRMNGNKVKNFEEKFSKYHNVKYCLALTNGTHALELALSVLGIGKDDEVIIPAVTFISTCTAVLYNNAIPILADIDQETYCLSPESFEKAITPRTKAVIAVHMAGHACDMEKICEIARKNNIYVIEDAAHAHGGKYKDKMLGSLGDIATFSFQNGKIMTCGEGGALLTNNEDFYKKAYLIHGVGRPEGDKIYQHKVLGSNYRMNEFQAAILLAQLDRLEKMNKLREDNSKILDEYLSNLEGIYPQSHKEYATKATHYMYMFYYDSKSFNNLSREQFVDYLNAEGIPAFVCFPVISNTEFFKNNDFSGKIDSYMQSKQVNLSNSLDIAENVVWLSHNVLLGDTDDLKEVRNAIIKIKSVVNRSE